MAGRKPVPIRRAAPGPTRPARTTPGRPVPTRAVPPYQPPPQPPPVSPHGPSPGWELHKALLLSGGAVPLSVLFRLRPMEVELFF